MVARKKQFMLTAVEIADRRQRASEFRKWSAIIKKRRATMKKDHQPPISTGSDDPLLKRLQNR